MRSQPRLHVLLAGTIAGMAVVASPAPALAQRPLDDCSVEDDSLRARSGVPGGMLGTMAIFVVAPSALLLFEGPECEGDDAAPGAWADHVAVFGAGGVAVTGDRRGGVGRGAGVEVLVRGVYAEGRMDRYTLSGGVGMWDARAGYVVRPTAGIAGGVTVGYREVRDAPAGWTQGGVLIGFPIVLTGCSDRRPCWFLWEPTYLIRDGTLAASPRARLDVPIPRTPLVARVDFESRGVRKADPITLGVGLGLRR